MEVDIGCSAWGWLVLHLGQSFRKHGLASVICASGQPSTGFLCSQMMLAACAVPLTFVWLQASGRKCFTVGPFAMGRCNP